MDSERCTVGQLHAVVWNRVRERLRIRQPYRKYIEEVRAALAEISGRAPRSIKLASRLENLIPPRKRRAAWKTLERRLNHALPRLGLSSTDATAFAAIGGVLAVVVMATVRYFSGDAQYRQHPMLAVSDVIQEGAFAAIVLGAALGAIVGFRHFSGRAIPEHYATVGALVSRAACDTRQAIPPVPWTAPAVWSHLCGVLADRTGISPRRLRPDQKLVADLGARPPVCRNCGYDLRGCWPQCPECGEVDG